MRGKHVSKPIEDLVKEAQHLAKNGTKELILIAQDLTYYGLDLYNKRNLDELLRHGIEPCGSHDKHRPKQVLLVVRRHATWPATFLPRKFVGLEQGVRRFMSCRQHERRAFAGRVPAGRINWWKC